MFFNVVPSAPSSMSTPALPTAWVHIKNDSTMPTRSARAHHLYAVVHACTSLYDEYLRSPQDRIQVPGAHRPQAFVQGVHEVLCNCNCYCLCYCYCYCYCSILYSSSTPMHGSAFRRPLAMAVAMGEPGADSEPMRLAQWEPRSLKSQFSNKFRSALKPETYPGRMTLKSVPLSSRPSSLSVPLSS